MEKEKRPRGRPRPEATIKRDAAILAYLREHGPRTRNQISAPRGEGGLGLEPVITYLALDRLRRDGLVRICAKTAGPGSVWSADVEAPRP